MRAAQNRDGEARAEGTGLGWRRWQEPRGGLGLGYQCSFSSREGTSNDKLSRRRLVGVGKALEASLRTQVDR